jgi:chaperonin GroEL
MNKKVYKYSDIEDRIVGAVDIITKPIAQTMSPKGGNVIYEDDQGNQHYTNDGVTIAKNISVKGDIENAIIEIIKGSSLKTNMEAGDGTSSTVLMSSVLIKEGLRLVRDGHNQMEVRDELMKFANDMKRGLSKMVVKIENNDDIKKIAQISANNDDAIAKDIAHIISIVKEDGQVIIDRGYTDKTELEEDTGFVIRSGVFSPELTNKQFQTAALDVPVFITDKRLYYKSEAETILQTVIDAGYDEVVIIAQDFIGEALPYFIANHTNNKIKVILVAEKKLEILEDLAIYLGGDVVSDKKGSLVNNITIDNFVLSKKVFSDPHKTIVSRDKKENNDAIEKRVRALKREMKKIGNKNSSQYGDIEKRISSLTTGMVTIKVGGATHLEVMERIYRYEDAINAARAALREGYLPGAGSSVYEAFKNIKVKPEYRRMFNAAAEVNIRQIAENCGKNPDSLVEAMEIVIPGFGYNAVTDKIEDLLAAGIIEPFLVTTQVIANAVSIANIIITSRYLIVNDLSEDKKNG